MKRFKTKEEKHAIATEVIGFRTPLDPNQMERHLMTEILLKENIIRLNDKNKYLLEDSLIYNEWVKITNASIHSDMRLMDGCFVIESNDINDINDIIIGCVYQDKYIPKLMAAGLSYQECYTDLLVKKSVLFN